MAKSSIFFVHGNSLSMEVFEHQLSHSVLKKKYELIAFDLPGHAKGPKWQSYPIDTMIDYLHGVISRSGYTEVILVGHSLGGHFCINLLSRNLPFNISHLLLVGTPPLKKPFDPSAFLPLPEGLNLFKPLLQENEIQEVAKLYGSESFVKFLKLVDVQFRQDLLDDLMEGHTYNEVELLSSFEGELCIVLGENDTLISRDYIKKLNLQLWKNSIQTITDAGHSPFFENARNFNNLLLEFLTGNEYS
jgi:pimeloyl-ACP methyl ester carboxylesterase